MFNAKKPRCRARAVTLAVLVIAVAACGENSADPSVVELIADRTHALTRAPVPYTSVVEAMPSVLYLVDGREGLRMSDAYVVGTVIDVQEGRSFNWTEGTDSSERIEVPFNSADAKISTVHLVIKVDRSIVAPGQPEIDHTTVTVGLALNAPVAVDAAREDLSTGGRVAVLLVRSSPVFDYDPALWAILDDGEFLGQVSVEGAVSFPALAKRGLVPDGLTIEQLEHPPVEPISVDIVNGLWVRN